MKFRDLLPPLTEADVREFGVGEPNKIPKPVVVYESPELNKKDFTCAGCIFFLRDTSGCELVAPSTVEGNAGCNLWVGGEPATSDVRPPKEAVPQEVVGYMNNGPFTCARCKYFKMLKKDGVGSCAKVEGPVHAKGCCNHWEG